MKIKLAIPCFIQQFYPQVARDVCALLDELEVSCLVPGGQTCCGQPLANGGFEAEAQGAYRHFVNGFGDADMTLFISGSCTYHVRSHYDTIEQTDAVVHLRKHIRDVTEFIFTEHSHHLPNVSFPHKVSLHTGCHSLRGLGMGRPSESNPPGQSFGLPVLNRVRDMEIIPLERPDECCGFGGTFAVNFPELSVRMGMDKLVDAIDKGVEVILSNDMSCLMHLDGIIAKRGLPLRTMHVLQVFNRSNRVL